MAPEILRVMESEGVGPGSHLLDAFAGGCSLSVAAKALGYRVSANDMSPCAEAVGEALIANTARTLADEEIALALTWPEPAEIPPEKQLALPKNCRATLASMVGYERQATGTTRWLVRAWIVKTAISMATWGVPTMAAGLRTWDQLTPGQATQLKRTGRPKAFARKLAEDLNAGVFDSGEPCTFHRGDAIAYIAETEADVLYLDPPYPGTMSYERTYVGVNRLLEPEADDTPSAWSAADGWQLLESAFDAAKEIPVWVVSMGKGADPDRIVAMMEARGRKAEHRTLDLQHLASLKTSHGEGGDELLIVGRSG